MEQNKESLKELEKILKREQTAKSEREQYDGRLHLLERQRSKNTILQEISQLKEEIDKLNQEDQQLTERLLQEKKKFLLFEFASRDLCRVLHPEIPHFGKNETEGQQEKKKRKRDEIIESGADKIQRTK